MVHIKIFILSSLFLHSTLLFSQTSTENSLTEKVKSLLFTESKSNINASGGIITNVSREELEARLNKIAFENFSYQYNTTNHGYVEKYLRMGNHFSNIIGLSEFYFPLFDEVFKKYNIPNELKYIAIVESKLTVKVTSRAGAKGLWQFMPGTAKIFGLENNAFVEERYDPIKSTEAAAKYFTYL